MHACMHASLDSMLECAISTTQRDRWRVLSTVRTSWYVSIDHWWGTEQDERGLLVHLDHVLAHVHWELQDNHNMRCTGDPYVHIQEAKGTELHRYLLHMTHTAVERI